MSQDLTKHCLSSKKDDFEGLTLDELRYRRAYVGARKDLAKEKLAYNLAYVRSNTLSVAGSTAKRIGAAIPMMNYAVMAFGIGKKVYKLFRRKRKN